MAGLRRRSRNWSVEKLRQGSLLLGRTPRLSNGYSKRSYGTAKLCALRYGIARKARQGFGRVQWCNGIAWKRNLCDGIAEMSYDWQRDGKDKQREATAMVGGAMELNSKEKIAKAKRGAARLSKGRAQTREAKARRGTAKHSGARHGNGIAWLRSAKRRNSLAMAQERCALKGGHDATKWRSPLGCRSVRQDSASVAG